MHEQATPACRAVPMYGSIPSTTKCVSIMRREAIMRPASKARLLCASMVLAGVELLPMNGGARAQVAFTGIQAFGDSYADIGNLWKFTGGVGQFPLYPTGRFSGGTNFVDTTS